LTARDPAHRGLVVPVKRGWVTALAGIGACAAVAAGPASASAAVTLGSDLTRQPNSSDSCFPDPRCTYANTALPGRTLAAPFDGVIVRWRVKGRNTVAGDMRLKVIRPAGGANFTGVATTPSHHLEVNATTTTHVVPARQPIAAGDLVALDLDEDTFANNFILIPPISPPGSILAEWEPSLADGETRAIDVSTGNEILFNADVEPDCDNDGFGDETQDADISVCFPDTAPPDTTITKGPKKKTKKKTATFEFSGTDARALAGFECSLDGGAFASCTSPHRVKVKKGKHTFEVRAIDTAGNRDASVATYSWKVKRKKKRK
jgi:hypothetical protein